MKLYAIKHRLPSDTPTVISTVLLWMAVKARYEIVWVCTLVAEVLLLKVLLVWRYNKLNFN